MNEKQNKTRPQKDARIKELEFENGLLKQKLAMIKNLTNFDDAVVQFKTINPEIKKTVENARPIATLWKADESEKIIVRVDNSSDREFLDNQFERIIKEKVGQFKNPFQPNSIKTDEDKDSLAEHLKKIAWKAK